MHQHWVSAALWASVALLAAGCAGGPPKLDEGFWDIRGESIEKPAGTKTEFAYRLCRTHAVDKAADDVLMNVKGCTTLVKQTASGTYSSASTCKVAGITVVSNGVTTYQSGKSVHSETQAVYTPPFRDKAAETMTQDQRYVGKCPAGVVPGDRIFADGIVRHHE